MTFLERIPLARRLKTYTRTEAAGDITAGIIVAVMLVPQSMAYALLADLPPEIGLYSSILPLIIYGLTGSAGMLAVGPTAITSLMVGEAIGAFGAVSTSEQLGLALALSLMIAVLMLIMGALNMGRVVNFLSHPVLSGFASAAAIVIALSQLRHLLGVPIPRSALPHEKIIIAAQNAANINLVTLAIGAAAIGVLLIFKFGVRSILKGRGVSSVLATPIVRLAPLVVVVGTTLIVVGFDLASTVDVVGQVPPGLPALTMPPLSLNSLQSLLPSAVAITLVSYTEGISVAKALSSKIRQRVDPNQELIAVGLANAAAAFTGGYPVAGGLSRSAVNFAAGARTGVSSIVTAFLIGLTVIFLMPLFAFLPQAALAAIIVTAIFNLFDFDTMRVTWQSNKADFAALMVTFGGVLLLGIEAGILLGLLVSVGHYMWQTSEPHIAVVGRVAGTEHYRNIRNYDVITVPDVLAIRVDENLYFANAGFLEETVLNAVADCKDLTHVVLIFSAVNYVDTSALDTLENLSRTLDSAGVDLSLAEVKVPVMSQLEQARFFDHARVKGVFLSTHQAVTTLEP